jgi:hypothetical protein
MSVQSMSSLQVQRIAGSRIKSNSHLNYFISKIINIIILLPLEPERGYHLIAVAYPFGFHVEQTSMPQTPQIIEQKGRWIKLGEC